MADAIEISSSDDEEVVFVSSVTDTNANTGISERSILALKRRAEELRAIMNSQSGGLQIVSISATTASDVPATATSGSLPDSSGIDQSILSRNNNSSDDLNVSGDVNDVQTETNLAEIDAINTTADEENLLVALNERSYEMDAVDRGVHTNPPTVKSELQQLHEYLDQVYAVDSSGASGDATKKQVLRQQLLRLLKNEPVEEEGNSDGGYSASKSSESPNPMVIQKRARRHQSTSSGSDFEPTIGARIKRRRRSCISITSYKENESNMSDSNNEFDNLFSAITNQGPATTEKPNVDNASGSRSRRSNATTARVRLLSATTTFLNIADLRSSIAAPIASTSSGTPVSLASSMTPASGTSSDGDAYIPPDLAGSETSDFEQPAALSTPKLHRNLPLKTTSSVVLGPVKQENNKSHNRPPNTDITIIASNPQYKKRCIICDCTIKSIYAHHIKTHPNCELYQSRLSPQMLRQMMDKQIDLNKVCVLCEKEHILSEVDWLDHLAIHMGNCPLKCLKCHQPVLYHRYHTKICGSDKYRRLIKMTLDSDNRLWGFACKLCNYIQLDEEAIIVHLEREHMKSDTGDVLQCVRRLIVHVFSSKETLSLVQPQQQQQQKTPSAARLSNSHKHIRNIDKRSYFSHPKYGRKCRLCDHASTRLAQHFIMKHPESELFTSRLSPKMVKGLIGGTIDLKFMCILCEKPHNDYSGKFWTLHYAANMNQMLNQCQKCRKYWRRTQDVCSCSKPMIKHLVRKDDNMLFGYVCKMCNYVQLTEKKIVMHLEKEHQLLDDNVITSNVLKVAIHEYSNSDKIVRKSPQKKPIASTSVMVCDDDTSTIQSTVTNAIIPKNTNIEMHTTNEKYQTKCVICDGSYKRLTNHYVKDHPSTEVYISRISPMTLLKLFYGVVRKSSIKAQCIFCNGTYDNPLANWFDHFTTHTGEYAYQCMKCNQSSAYKMTAGSHKCGIGNVVKNRSFAAGPDGIDALICTLCNYVQFEQASMQKHVKNEHEIMHNVAVNYKTVRLLSYEQSTFHEQLPSGPEIPEPEILPATVPPQPIPSPALETAIVCSVKNNNPNMYLSNQMYASECIACDGPIGSSLQAHYFNHHGDNFLCRLSPAMLEEARTRTQTTTKIGSEWKTKCLICEQTKQTTKFMWLTHIIKCHTKETFQRSVSRYDNDILAGFVCKLCNYVQILKENVHKHIITQHIDVPDVMNHIDSVVILDLNIKTVADVQAELQLSPAIMDNAMSSSSHLMEIPEFKDPMVDTNIQNDRLDAMCPEEQSVAGVTMQSLLPAPVECKVVVERCVLPSLQTRLSQSCGEDESDEISLLDHIDSDTDATDCYWELDSNINMDVNEPTFVVDNIEEDAAIEARVDESFDMDVNEPKFVVDNIEEDAADEARVDEGLAFISPPPPVDVGVPIEVANVVIKTEPTAASDVASTSALQSNVAESSTIVPCVAIKREQIDAAMPTTVTAESNTTTPTIVSVKSLCPRPSTSTLIHPPNVDVINLKRWLPNADIKSKAISEFMLRDASLASLFKCMDTECAFSCQSVDRMTTHLQHHDQYLAAQCIPADIKMPLARMKYLECSYCSVVCSTSAGLIEHVIDVHSQSIFQCQYCFYRSVDAFSVVFHQRKYHIDQSPSIIICDLRNRKRYAKEQMESMLAGHMYNIKPITCELDGRRFECIDHYLWHYKHQHTPSDNKIQCQFVFESNGRKCNLLLDSDKMKQHLNVHGIADFNCCQCVFIASRYDRMRQHIVDNHPEQLMFASTRIYHKDHSPFENNNRKLLPTIIVNLAEEIDIDTVKVRVVDTSAEALDIMNAVATTFCEADVTLHRRNSETVHSTIPIEALNALQDHTSHFSHMEFISFRDFQRDYANASRVEDFVRWEVINNHTDTQ